MRKSLTFVFTIALLATSLVAFSSTSASGEETATASPSPTPTTFIAPQSTSSDGTYTIGSVGPGGGFIFYFDKAGFKCGPKFTKTGSPTGGLCHYLEVAPSGWKSGKSGDMDPYLAWAILSNSRLDAPDVYNETKINISSSTIGLGYKNSMGIVKQGNDVTTAAGAARAYRGGSKSDWYLPSLAELNNLIKWARGLAWISNATVASGGTVNSPKFGAGTAGFIQQSGYWSSTEAYFASDPAKLRRASAWFHLNHDDPQLQLLQRDYKQNARRTRPIRAF